MLKKILATVSVAALVAGAAHAVELENNLGLTVADPTPLAAELDYAGGNVDGNLSIGFGPSAGLFPTGNVLVFVNLSGATFDGALTGAEAGGALSTSVISTGGQNGQSQVTFLVSGANNCAVASGAGAGTANCTLTLPVILNGADVNITVGLETDAGAPVDNTSQNSPVGLQLVDILPAFDISFSAAAGGPANVATLASLFTTLTDNDLGDIIVAVNDLDGDPVNKTLSGVNVVAGDIDELNFVLDGIMDPFATGAGTVEFGGNTADDIDAVTDEATYDAGPTLGTFDVVVTENGTTAIQRSSYTASVEIVPTALSGLVSNTTASGSLQPIVRDGTSIIFPWTQSATVGAVSGATSVFRIGNLDTSPAGAVFAEVRNSASAGAGYVDAGIVQLAPSIAAGGEFVTNSTGLEAALGDYGRGDIEFTIEAQSDELTGRQFVVRNGVIQQVQGGTIQQDLQ